MLIFVPNSRARKDSPYQMCLAFYSSGKQLTKFNIGLSDVTNWPTLRSHTFDFGMNPDAGSGWQPGVLFSNKNFLFIGYSVLDFAIPVQLIFGPFSYCSLGFGDKMITVMMVLLTSSYHFMGPWVRIFGP